MGRLDDIFADARGSDAAILMPFIVGGYPSLDATEMVLAGIDTAGAKAVEIGLPFSDPIADGPVIAGAMHEALCNGTTIQAVLDTVARARDHTQAALIAMVSQSIVHRLGDNAFIRRLADAGFDGVIVPDIDTNIAEGILSVVDQLDMSMAMLIAPTTESHRIPELLERCRGFIYLLARTGLTGANADLAGLADRVAELRRHSDLPIAAGFGISTADDVRQATESCDAAIVGSALVGRMRQSQAPAEDALASIEALSKGLRGA